ncbi:MAG: hypothetical protein AB9869_34370 [Verrucomicrobiia bacterium]
MKPNLIPGQISRWAGIALATVATLLALVTFASELAGKAVSCKEGQDAVLKLARDQWGIEIVAVRVSAGGYMIDFRYKVVDPDKAVPLAKRESKPYIIDEASKAKLLVPNAPKIGSLRQTAVKLSPGRVYGAMFANPALAVKAGSKVTVVIGECRLAHLTVR